MPITGASNRVKSYSDVIAFPASKLAGPLTQISSVIMYPFRGNGDKAMGPARIMLSATDRTKVSRRGATPVGDSIYVNVYAGWEDPVVPAAGPGARADTWMRVGTYTDLRYAATGALPITAEYIIPIAEKIKIVATIPSADSMSPGHGARVDVEFQEMYGSSNRASYFEKPYGTTTFTMPATRAFGDSVLTAATTTYYSPALNCGFSPSRVYTYVQAENRAAITTATAGHGSYAGKWQLTLQSSPDGSRWFDGDSFADYMRPNGGVGSFLAAEEFSAGTSVGLSSTTVKTITGYPGKLNSYLRIKAYGDTWCGLTAGHGIKFFMIAFE